MRGRPTSRFEPYKMAWVMIDLINVARPVLVYRLSDHPASGQRLECLLPIELCNLVYIDVDLHHRRGGEDQ